jgi:hydrogenase maturation protein HypF
MTTFQLPQPSPARVLAFGAWLKNTACRLDGDVLRWSPLHGDLGEPAARLALERSVQTLATRGPVDAVAHDLHPDFHSTELALALAERLGVPAHGVQHHHAHIAAVQAEHGFTGPVVGLALDGVGLGLDGLPWGGELLWVDGAQWRRLGHLSPIALPGGDTAAREPWRMAAAALHGLGRGGEIGERFGGVVGAATANGLQAMLARGLNCTPTSSTGRWFDAAAGALGLSVRQAAEAEAAIALERAAAGWLAGHEPQIEPSLAPLRGDGELDLHPLLARLFALADAGGHAAAAEGAALFHVVLAHGLARWAAAACDALGVGTVALGGGCFFNQVLASRVVAALRGAGLRVLQAQDVNCGDAGLALGQAWVAAQRVVAHLPTETVSCA